MPERATPVGAGLGPLTPRRRGELGLTPATRVAAGLIDAHAGALGVLGHLAGTPEIERHVALIAGTSSCVMTLAAAPRFVPGVWGPYLGGALPGLWLSEGGQSASGALLDHLLRLHGHAATPALHARVAARIAELRAVTPDLAPRLHVLPDFHGSRSPDPDPHALGVISGLPLDASFDALCRLYWRTSVAIALGLRLVVEQLRAHGQSVEALHLAGGHARNPLLRELYADATGYPIVEPAAPDAVLLGTAMVAAAGCGLHPSLAAAGAAMHQGGTRAAPTPPPPPPASATGRRSRRCGAHRAELDRFG